MPKTWAISFGEKERMELERVVMDGDEDGALKFINEVVYPKVKEAEKPGSCFHEVGKQVDDIKRPIRKHKNLGDFT